jgi:hypothetical protein
MQEGVSNNAKGRSPCHTARKILSPKSAVKIVIPFVKTFDHETD